MQPQQPAYIIGKHESAKEFKDIDWSRTQSFGINHAAIWYNTKYAFTGHDEIFKEFQALPQFSNSNVILSQPFFEGTTAHISEYGFKIQQNPNEDVYNYIDLTDGEIRYHLLKAFQRDPNFFFPNYWTSLHLLIFFLIWHGYKEIFIIGCNLELCDTMSNLTQQQCEYAHRHTERMITFAQELNVKIHWVKDRNHYILTKATK